MNSDIRTQVDPFFGAKKIGPVVVKFVDVAIVIGAIAVFLYLVLGGIEYITAGGDKVKTENAQKMITGAIMGLAILVLSWVIFGVIMRFLGIDTAFSTSSGLF